MYSFTLIQPFFTQSLVTHIFTIQDMFLFFYIAFYNLLVSVCEHAKFKKNSKYYIIGAIN